MVRKEVEACLARETVETYLVLKVVEACWVCTALLGTLLCLEEKASTVLLGLHCFA